MKVAILSLGLLAAVGSARADEETIKVKDLPKAVLAAVKARFPEAKVVGAAREEEDGKTTYEVILEDDDAKMDVAVSPKGKILEVEKAIPAGDLPKAVASAIKAKYPKARIKKAEEVIKFEEDDDDDETFFEVVLTFEGKDSVELKLSPKGKILDDGEDEDDDDEKREEKEKGKGKKKGKS